MSMNRIVALIVSAMGADIRAWLGHIDMRTTSIYTEINLATKRKAIEMCSPRGTVHGKRSTWKKSPDILAWLEAL